ncbi:VUT family protein [Flavobacterium terrigena]|uniref:Putative vitamin uptake transporter n=1 Tax=Flavobacterium terrigena TaxID=402734 RepID=A0A1H6Y8E9_9FLAO|nr:VUT family protein [Flavobacterium terrigena]SEJ33045.1 Putative vitamin uptake transporter [Flavobacterium terrigena]
MDTFIYLLLETLIVGLMILGLHASKKHFGIGLLYIFLGTMQFFQTILSGNVYNLYFDVFLFSPGSTLIFISTLFAVLLIFRNESIIKVRSVIYGIILSNIILVFLSYISLEQILSDNFSRNTTFLAEIFNFDIRLFLTGIILLYLDMILIMFVFRYLESKFSKNYFLQFIGASVVTAVLDSVLFYSINFYSELNYSEMMIGNIAGKVLVCFILSALFAFYFVINPEKDNKRKALTIKDIIMIINFTTSGKR